MYAATKEEHILISGWFCITRSSTNVLITTRFFWSYLSSNPAKTEENSDGRILTAQDGKSFRLRTEGIQNKFLASAKILDKLEMQRQTEKTDCRIVSLTESVFWTLSLPLQQWTSCVLKIFRLRYVQNSLRENNSDNDEKYLTFRDTSIYPTEFQKFRRNSQKKDGLRFTVIRTGGLSNVII